VPSSKGTAEAKSSSPLTVDRPTEGQLRALEHQLADCRAPHTITQNDSGSAFVKRSPGAVGVAIIIVIHAVTNSSMRMIPTMPFHMIDEEAEVSTSENYPTGLDLHIDAIVCHICPWSCLGRSGWYGDG